MKACNKDTTKRNTEIISLHESGRKPTDIARHFGLSRSRTWQILKRARDRELFHQRGVELRRQLQEANDLTLKMSLDDILCAMSMKPSLSSRLFWHYTNRGIKELSLADFMEFLIPETSELTGLDTSIPAYRAYRLHHKTYGYIIAGINQVDLGKAFNASWAKRKARLKAVLFSSNHSAPYLLNCERPAL
jgi:hypothetical protein